MWKQKFNITPGTSKLDIKGRMGLRDMWYRFCPVDGSEGIFGLLSQRNKSSKTERILRQNIDSDQDCHEEFQRNGDKWYNSPPPISNTQSTGATTKGITGKTKEVICTPERPFEASRKREVPPDAVGSSKGDTKYNEDDHTGVSVARGSWGIKRRDVFAARSEGVGSKDAKDSGESERGNEDNREKWAKDDKEGDKNNEKGRENQTRDDHALLIHGTG